MKKGLVLNSYFLSCIHDLSQISVKLCPMFHLAAAAIVIYLTWTYFTIRTPSNKTF